jgi:spermidine synthase
MLALVQILMAMLAISTMLLYDELFGVMQFLIRALAKTVEGYNLFSFASHLLALSLMLPVTFCAGMTLPLITNILLKNNHNEADIGRVYAINTVGAIVGTIVAVNLIMPTLGLKYVLGIGAILDLTIGIILLKHDSEKAYFKSFSVFSGTVCCIFVISFMTTNLNYAKMASGVFRHGNLFLNHEIIYHKDGKTASVDVIKTDNNNMYIATNGKPDASYTLGGSPSPDETTQILLGAIPYSILPQAKNIAIIGYGSGMTARVLLESNHLEKLDIIEIEPAIVEGAQHFNKIAEMLNNDKRVTIHIEDAKAFFSSHPKQKYDLIISEPSNPWVSGVSSLFTYEFYALIKNYLTPNGLFAQWLHTYEIYPYLVASVANSMAKEFKAYEVFFTGNADVIFMASNHANIPTMTEQAFNNTGFIQLMQRIGINNFDELKSKHLANKQLLEPYFASYSVAFNSDFFPVLDLNSERARFVYAADDTLLQLKNSIIPWHSIQNQGYQHDAKNIKSNPFFSNSTAMQQVYIKYKYLANKENSPNLSIPMLQNLELLTTQDKLCTAAEQHDSKYIQAWNNVFLENTFEAISFLNHDQYSVIWNNIKPVCIGLLDLKNQTWIAMLDSWIHGDYIKTADLSNALLTNLDVVPGSNEYLKALNMNILANIKLKDYSTAFNTWQSNTFRDSSVVLRMLGNYAYAKSKQGV